MNEWTLHFDGLCEPNPGGVMSWGFVLDFGDDQRRCGQGSVQRKPVNTCNVAEWCGLGCALNVLADVIKLRGRPDRLMICGDSQLVIYQLIGKWRTKAPHLGECRRRCLETLRGIDTGDWWSAEWVGRENNDLADALSRQAFRELTGRDAPERHRAGAR